MARGATAKNFASSRVLAPGRQQSSAGSRYSGLQRAGYPAAFMFDPFEAYRSEQNTISATLDKP
jgi:hypothetical protein